MAKCAVPPGQIAAAAGPYKVSAYYSGGDDVAPSADTIVQHLARANSVLTLRITPKLLPGRQVLLAATVKESHNLIEHTDGHGDLLRLGRRRSIHSVYRWGWSGEPAVPERRRASSVVTGPSMGLTT